MTIHTYASTNCTMEEFAVNAGKVVNDMFNNPVLITTLVVCTTLTVVTVALMVESVYHVAKHVPRSGVANHRLNTCIMLALYPCYAFLHLPGVWVPSVASFCTTCATIVYSLILYKFLTLLVDYYGGHRRMMVKINTQDCNFPLTVAPLLAFCCCFKNNLLKPRRLTERNITVLKVLVLQVAFIRPILNFVIAIFTIGNIERWDSPITGMTLVMIVSTLTAMTALNMLFTASEKTLHKFNLRPKFYLIKMGMIVGNLQMAIFRVASNFWFFRCFLQLPFETRASYWQCITIIFESFFLFLLSRKFYRGKKGNVVGKSKPVLDILSDEGELGTAVKMRNWIRRHSWRRNTFA